MTKALVTGGAGFVGYHLSKHLAELNYQVTVLDSFVRDYRGDDELTELFERPNVKLVNGDLLDQNFFSKLDDHYDYIYHLAAINGTSNFYTIPEQVLKVGILGTLNLLEWFKNLDSSCKVLFSSSGEVYAGAMNVLGDSFPIPTPEDIPLVVDDPSNMRWSYGAGKILSEVAFHVYANQYGFLDRFRIIRYHNIYGPRMGFNHVLPEFIERIVKKEFPFTIKGGDETRAFCYVDDAVEATRIVMESEKANGETVHIGKSDEIQITEFAKILFQIASVDPDIDFKPAPSGSVLRRCPNTSKLKELGFEAMIPIEEGLSKSYEWYKPKFEE